MAAQAKYERLLHRGAKRRNGANCAGCDQSLRDDWASGEPIRAAEQSNGLHLVEGPERWAPGPAVVRSAAVPYDANRKGVQGGALGA